jgi:hypothetical protein
MMSLETSFAQNIFMRIEMPRKHRKSCRRCHCKLPHHASNLQDVLKDEEPILKQEEEVIQAEIQALDEGAQVLLGAQVPPNTIRSQILGPGPATFTIPAGVTRLHIVAYGGGGDGGTGKGLGISDNAYGGGGGGGFIHVFINVTPGLTFTCNVGANAQPTTLSSSLIGFTVLPGQNGGVGPTRQGGGQGAPEGPLNFAGLPFITPPNRQPGTNGQPGENLPTLRPPLVAGTGNGGQGGRAFTPPPIQGFAFMSAGGAGGRDFNNGFSGFGLGAGGGGGGGGLHTVGARGNDGLIAFLW